MQSLSTCNCCDGLAVEVPVLIDNLPGLNAVAYRVGRQPAFRQSLLARLTTSGQQALRQLTTRNNNDFSIALLDAWAVVADVLTFYQERIVNESFLRTATERLSILELARLVGYELAPGISAGTWIAFTLNDHPGALGPVLPVTATPNAQVALPPVTIPVGTAIKSIPGPGEAAQTYETSQAIIAHPEWNAIPVRTRLPQILKQNTAFLVVNGLSVGVSKGDVVMIYVAGSGQMRKVANVSTDKNLKTTRLDLFPMLGNQPSVEIAYKRQQGRQASQSLVAEHSPLVNNTLLGIQNTTWNGADFSALISSQNWSVNDVTQALGHVVPATPPSADQVVVLKKRAAVFGYNAPKEYVPTTTTVKHTTINDNVGTIEDSTVTTTVLAYYREWDLANERPGNLWLDGAYPEVISGGFIAIQTLGSDLEESMVLPVNAAETQPRSDYGLSAKSTLVTFDKNAWSSQPVNGDSLSDIRGVTVYAQSEVLELTDIPIPDFLPAGTMPNNDVQGLTVTLDGLYDGLVPGQKMILTGNRTDLPGTSASELVILHDVAVDVEADNAYTVLTFTLALAHTYQRSTVTINGNVADATDGASFSEVLGSGDATQVFQTFQLKQSPLTYTSSAKPGGASSLTIRVNDLLWSEVPYFYGHGPTETIFITRREDSGKTNVLFGDGNTGARLPTGQSNVKATYRVGTGVAGLVDANQLSQLTGAPSGVKSAVNPIAPSGAEDPEGLNDARKNATLTILALDRVVSLQDYADYARAFGGFDKTLATWTWNGFQRCIYLTVAGAEGRAIDPKGDLCKNLVTAILANGDPNVPLTVASYQAVYFQLSGSISKDPVFLAADISAAVEAALRDHFSFDNRQFGQGVAYSEVVAVIQDVAGVVAVNVTQLYITGDIPATAPPSQLSASVPQPGTGTDNAFPAQLLTLDPRPLNLTILS
jgi:predicted phage baseplate assembly protein